MRKAHRQRRQMAARNQAQAVSDTNKKHPPCG
jgi:hypothetical protein